ncbi:DUF3047 domain-containing protein [Thauera sp. WH-2]|jgi:hypothetical protein|uniref:DUF3047 domain-containing protein n=1 Tax=unclassified Thauera TaxID=2609274 RepID=UPI003AAC8D55
MCCERSARTQYALRTWDGVSAAEAVAERSMALLGRPIEIDLEATPHLFWLWRVDAPLATADMTTKAGDTKAGDDYVARDEACIVPESATRRDDQVAPDRSEE